MLYPIRLRNHGWTVAVWNPAHIELCAGARRDDLDIYLPEEVGSRLVPWERFRPEPIGHSAPEPLKESLVFQVFEDGRLVRIEFLLVPECFGITEVLVVGDAERLGLVAGVAEVTAEGRLHLAPHPGVLLRRVTSSGGGEGHILYARLAPEHPPLVLRYGKSVRVIYPDGTFEATDTAALLARLSEPAWQ